MLLLDLLGVTVEEHVDHDIPTVRRTGNRAAEAEDLAGKEPPSKTDGVPRLVVDGDGNVNELQGSVGVAEGDDRDVDVGRLADGLVINARVRDNDETGLLERAGDVVCKVTGGETTSNGLRAGVRSEFQNGTVAVWAGGDDTDIVRVLDRGNDTGSEN